MVHQTLSSRLVLAATFALSAAPFPVSAQKARTAELGRIKVSAEIRGQTFTESYTRVKAPFEGRVQSIVVAPNQFISKGDVVAILVPQELAAILDADRSTPDGVLSSRWKKMYRPKRVKAPADGLVLKLDQKVGAEVKRGDFVATLAGSLAVVSEFERENERWIQEGQRATLWPASNPANRLDGEVVALYPGNKRRAPTVKVVVLPSAKGVGPGEDVEGFVLSPNDGKGVMVPERALTRFGNQSFLMIRVDTGITHRGKTEIRAGLEPGETYLDPEEKKSRRIQTKQPKRRKER